jgi:NADPH2:quinone reductase
VLTLQIERFGDPAEVLRLREGPAPEVSPGQVLVRIRGAPIHPIDLGFIRGEQALSPLPATPGSEGSGVVERVGDGVSSVRVGERVAPFAGLCGRIGTWQECFLCPAAEVVRVPDSIPDSTAHQLFSNPLSAYAMAAVELALKPTQWLVQTAAGSTIGRLILQLARVLGFHTINVVRRPEQAAELRALGADAVICNTREDVTARILELTAGHGADAAIDAVGGELGSAVLHGLKPGGALLVYGQLSGKEIPAGGDGMIVRETTARGFFLPRWFSRLDADRREQLMKSFLRLVAEGKLVPPVEARYPLSAYAAAVRHAESPGRSGKVLFLLESVSPAGSSR